MSVQTEIDRIIGLVHESHEKAQSKGGTTTTPLLANLPGVIDSIPQGVELPELGDTAAKPTDMAADKVLYDDEGNPMTGELHEIIAGERAMGPFETLHGNPGDTVFSVDAVFQKNVEAGYGVIIRKGAILCPRNIPTSLFGDATADQVAKGATFTSAAGLLVEGTHECEAGVTLPELTNPATASDLALDKQLIDGSGNILTGTLQESGVGTDVMAKDAAFWGTGDNTQFSLSGVYSKGHIGDADFRGFICRPGTNFVLRSIPTSLFGTAEANQVAKGATFTSAAGLLVEGTMEPGITPSGSLDITENGTFDVTNYASVNVEVPEGPSLPEGAIAVQMVTGDQTSTKIGSGYSLSVTYGDAVEIDDSITLAFVGTSKTLSNISASTNFSALDGKYVRVSSGGYTSTSYKFYYIPSGATFTVDGSSMSKTLTCDKAQAVTLQKVSL